MNNRTLIYARVSQWTKPDKLNNQLEKVREHCKIHNYNVIHEISEITNERRSNRSAIRTIKDMIDQNKIDIIMSEGRDILFHNDEDLEGFVKYADDRGVLVITRTELLNKMLHVPGISSQITMK
ncbi:MAG: recombinase family protein [Erysipelotrichaceae bacterium]|nr:recombinase family protein [Erysipelotrichaceae bacterium]